MYNGYIFPATLNLPIQHIECADPSGTLNPPFSGPFFPFCIDISKEQDIQCSLNILIAA